MSVVVLNRSQKNLRLFFEEVPEMAEQAMMMSINKAARDTTNMLRREAYGEIAFPSGYLEENDRLAIKKHATRGNLQATITARDRPTSLARFAPRQTPEGSRGHDLIVGVKKGKARRLKRPFLIRLRSGNIGMAIRLKEGETLTNSREMKAVHIGDNVYLLYGPSVEQVVGMIIDESTGVIADKVTDEFFRQFARLSRAR